MSDMGIGNNFINNNMNTFLQPMLETNKAENKSIDSILADIVENPDKGLVDSFENNDVNNVMAQQIFYAGSATGVATIDELKNGEKGVGEQFYTKEQTENAMKDMGLDPTADGYTLTENENGSVYYRNNDDGTTDYIKVFDGDGYLIAHTKVDHNSNGSAHTDIFSLDYD